MASKKNMFNKIGVSKDIEKEMVFAIQDYFLKEREEDLGNLEASFILDFFMEKLAPQIYNQGVYDSYKYMEERTEDLLGILKG